MNYTKLSKNILLFVLFVAYIAFFFFSIVHLDFSRDVRKAFDIVNGVDFPLNGQIFGGKLRLGPMWYYFLAFLVWIFNDWLHLVIAMAAISGTQIFFAYILGKDFANKQVGLILAALLLFPSWGFFEQLLPTHVLFTPLLIIIFYIGTIRYKNKGKIKYLYIQSLAFSLALHAHPTALVAIIPSLYFNIKGFKKFGCKTHSLFIAALLFTLPFSPMLWDQAKHGFPLLEQILSHTASTSVSVSENKEWSKIYTLPFAALLGGNYISELMDGVIKPLHFYAIVVFVFLLLIAVDAKVVVKNIILETKYVGIIAWFFILLFGQTLILIFLSSMQSYYYVTSLKLFILMTASVAVEKIINGTRLSKYFIASLFLATFCSSVALVHYAALWSQQGMMPINFFPLIDISTKKSEGILNPIVTTVHVHDLQNWLCKEESLSLHGLLANYLIYNYTLESYFGCPGKNFNIGFNGNQRDGVNADHRRYIGISDYLAKNIKNKNSVRVGAMHIYPVSRALGTAAFANPSVQNYPLYSTFSQNDSQSSDVKIVALLNQQDLLAVTDFSRNYSTDSAVVVQTIQGKKLKPIAADGQTKIYQCENCPSLELKIIFSSKIKDRIDVVVF